MSDADPITTTTRLRLEMALGTLRFGILAFLVAFSIVEGMRLLMIVTGSDGPPDETWMRLSGIQQVGWQFMLACYGVLLAGAALLRTSTRSDSVRGWSTGAIVCLTGALACRGTLISGGTILPDESLGMLVGLVVSAENWCVLGAFVCVDMAMRRLGEIVRDNALTAAAAAHAMLAGALALAILIRQVTGPSAFPSGGQTLESVLTFSLGTICFAWAFRLTSDATRVCGLESAGAGDRARNRPST